MVKEILKKLSAGKNISFEESSAIIDAIAEDQLCDSQIAAFLTALKVKGEQPQEVAGCVQSLRKHAIEVPHNQKIVFDCCGTGGDGTNSFNISTAAGLVVAACGVAVAKHGNRAVSSSCGSADILEVAGVNLEISPEHSAKLLDELGFCFLFAPLYHPATKRVAKVRRELAFPTMFNLLGPLLNPAKATHQIIGTPKQRISKKLAIVAGQISDLNVVTYTNSSGCDELLPTAENISYKWNSDSVHQKSITIPSAIENNFNIKSIQGGDRKTNLQILNDLLDGNISPVTEVTAFNAAFGLHCVEKVTNLDDGYQMALDALKSGAVRKLFDQFISYSNEKN